VTAAAVYMMAVYFYLLGSLVIVAIAHFCSRQGHRYPVCPEDLPRGRASVR
jgi:hypothetical protein